VLGEDAQQRAQLQPPVLQWDTMPINYKAKLSEAIAAACMHTHPFNGPFSGTTRVSRYQKGKTNLDFTEARDSE